jgi:hypothetical protein
VSIRRAHARLRPYQTNSCLKAVGDGADLPSGAWNKRVLFCVCKEQLKITSNPVQARAWSQAELAKRVPTPANGTTGLLIEFPQSKLKQNKSAMKTLIPLLAVLLVSLFAHAADFALTVTGEVKNPLTLTLTELESMPAETIRATDHDGSAASYQGVPLHAILARAGVPQGESLRGEALQLCVLVKAADGYKVACAVAESDPLFTEKKLLLAYRRNGKELDSKAGPLRLVIPDEKRQGRWVREVTELEVVRVGAAEGGK